MSEFITPLVVQKLDDRRWQLKAALIYHSSLIDRTIVVPEGFITDFASVPRLPLAYLMTGGKASQAAVVHDWLYSTQLYARDVADAIFHEAILAEGYSRFTAWLMWAGVRMGGGFVWDEPNLEQPRHIDLEG